MKIKMCSFKFLLAFFGYFIIGTNGQGRISGGEAVEIGQYPFATSLVTNGGQGQYLHACGGAVISPTAILSAASCFYTNAELDPAAWWRARVGSSFSATQGLIYLIRLITPHPAFSLQTRDVDLAVLRTTMPMSLQPGVVQAAFIAGGATVLATQQPVQAIGWGATTAEQSGPSAQLNHVEMYVVQRETCASRYSEVGFTVTDNMVCAAWLDVLGRAQCLGDNGSPLLNSAGAIVGVHSYTEECAQSWYPSINTLVTPFTRWIVNTATA